MTAHQFWTTQVKSKDDIVTYYKTYYPCLPDVVAVALANHLQGAVDGSVELKPEWINDNTKQFKPRFEDELWEEIEKQR